jgi:hypothetical protein
MFNETFLKMVASIAVALGLAACGGGGGGGDDEPIPAGQSTAGIWRGTVTLDGDDSALIIGMIDENGNSNLILYGGNTQLRGSIESIGADINTSFSSLTLFGFTGDLIDVFSFLGGTVSEGATLTATLLGSTSNRNLRLDLHYDSLYERPSSFALVAGNWRYTLGADFIREWQIDAKGVLTGNDSGGCIYQGQVTIPNPARNLYRMNYQISGCYPNAVQVAGQAVLYDTLTPNDTLHSAGTGTVGLLNTDSFVELLTRQ